MSKRKLENNITDLNEPPPKKQRLNHENDIKFKPLSFNIDYYGVSDKGKRAHMEDRRIAISDLSAKLNHPFTTKNNCRLFCVIDGHGGSSVSSYCQTHLPSIFIDNLQKYVISNEEKEENMHENIQRALHATFKLFDEKILKMIGWMKSEGATCTLVYFQNDIVFTANIGDSKAVLARISKETANEIDFEEHKVQALLLTKDHTVLQLSEVKRIESCNGYIINGRVNGILEVTRCFGDSEMKKIGVIAAPNISKFKVCKRDKFMIIGCDGLWSVFSVSDAVEFVYRKFNHVSRPSVEEVTRQLLADAILNKQAKDNVSAIIVRFNHD